MDCVCLRVVVLERVMWVEAGAGSVWAGKVGCTPVLWKASEGLRMNYITDMSPISCSCYVAMTVSLVVSLLRLECPRRAGAGGAGVSAVLRAL